MNHNPFENWIFEDELEPGEVKQLNAHLQACPACKALKTADLEAKRLMRSASISSPEAGFTNRWLVFAHRQEEQAQKKQVAILFSIFITLAAIATTILITASRQQGIEIVFFLQSSLTNFLHWFQRLVITLNSFRFVLSVLPFRVPAIVWIFLVGNLGFWALVWTFSIWKFPSIRKVLA